MKKLLAAFLVLMAFSASSQTLFTYGNQSVSVNEFLRAYRKNNSGPQDEKSLRDYLDLYIASRLKIKEAKRQRFDTLPQLVSDLANLRQQILPNYINNTEGVQKLVDEAVIRSQKDIQLAHIFISFKQGTPENMAEAKRKLNLVTSELKKGTSFHTVAQEFSDDPAAKNNGGNLGWITVFSLPYDLENLAYSTPVGQTSSPYQSKAGYHIIKKLSERKSLGRIKAAQILLAFPPDADVHAKENVKKLSDSLYSRLMSGEDFGSLAEQFSNDVVSAASKGTMLEFGVGEFDPDFERVFYTLKQGEISKPILTSFGYHIVKLLSKTPISTNPDEKERQALKAKVEQSDRMASANTALAKKVLSKVPLTSFISPKIAGAYVDSLVDKKKPEVPFKFSPEAVLFKIGNKKVTAHEWLQFAQSNRYKADGSGAKPNTIVWEDFKNAKALEYYEQNLEHFNDEFRQQIKEFEEGNLFFEIMQKQVWTPAQTDSAALAKYFENNKAKYTWGPSAAAILFFAPNEASANHLKAHLSSPASWRGALTGHGDISADSSRFELSQLPGVTKESAKSGFITPVVVNPTDKTASFAYIVEVYDKPQPRTFSEAKGLVINDYQNELEKKWLAQLRKKYPVVINQKALNDLIKQKRF